MCVCVSVSVSVCVCVCVCVCVSVPDMDLIQLVKQVLQLLYDNYRALLSLMGVDLALIHIVETNPLRVS